MVECQVCHNERATVHITDIVNGDRREIHICQTCAQSKGIIYKFQLTVQEALQGLLSPKQAKLQREMQARKCPGCGLSFQELQAKVRLGCSQCLDTFQEWIAQFVERVHGASQHTGKTPPNLDHRRQRENRLLKLRREMEEAIRKEDYERAAQIRDQLRGEGDAG